ncbi:hypothetical protein JTB14_035433 [Gonioctena quinquepunctata]|nr:hypothetical protein JTB14_035433 [Gonioctena quinquepunctata]
MYTGSKGMSGWPPYEERIVPDITTQNWCDILYEPIMYFLDTAKNTVDVAIMMISVKKIYQALINARRRNVKVRVLLNYEHCERMLPEIRKCIEEGIEVQLFISPKPNQASIMHYKFIVKDYSANSGYVLVGSMNFSESAFLENYEDLVISSNHYVAEGFHECFEKCLSFVKDDNESLINKMMLLDMNLT